MDFNVTLTLNKQRFWTLSNGLSKYDGWFSNVLSDRIDMANYIIFLNLMELFNHSASTHLKISTFSADTSIVT